MARELVRLATAIVLGAAIALALAAILAVSSVGGSFSTNLRIAFLLVGCVVLAMAGVGRGSNLERYSDSSVTKVLWGTLPGIGVLRTKPSPDERSLTAGAVFVGVAVVLLALGVLF